MSPRQLAPGWLVVVSCLSAWPAAAQTPASGAASAPRAAASAAPAAAASRTARPPARKPAAKAPAKPVAAAAPAPSAVASTPTTAAPASGAAAAEMAVHERELDAIRRALVETAVSAPVRVQSIGWIDSQGRLHEESQFTSDARVRGVRVQAYLEDPVSPSPPAPTVKVDLEALPTGVGRRVESDPAQCLARNGRWRQNLHLEVLTVPGLGGPLTAQAERTAQALVPLLTAAGQESRRWVLRPRPYQAASAYERALIGREADTVDWVARVSLMARASGQLEAELQLLPQGHLAPPKRLRLALPGPQASAVIWAERMAEWVATLDRETACDPMWFAVQGQGTSLRLREGGSHGLQAGDRLLLVRRQHLGGRLLEPGAVRATALLQVEAGGSTALRWLAGLPPAAGGAAVDDWVALPL